jgi:ankyrin repeat protein
LFAAIIKNLNDVKQFIANGADINAQYGYGNTPLMLAAQANN